MLPLASKNLPADVQNILDALQDDVNGKADFVRKVKRAQDLWKSKGGTKGKKAFIIISKELLTMCVSTGICNYCEQSEASDIEHIFPKSFFPEYTFVWTNYLLACKQCNSGFKLDKCFVLNQNGQIVEVLRKTEPKHKTVALINPRTEDPNHFMILSKVPVKNHFVFEVLPGLPQLDMNKAIKTLDILQLNSRDTLLEARKNAAKYYYQRMKMLTDLLSAGSIAEIENLLTPYDKDIDILLSLTELKVRLKASIRKDIAGFQHPSVWYSIKIIESKLNTQWQAIFNAIPEALDW